VALAAAAIVAFLPEFALVGSSVSNDSAAALLGTLGLWGGVRIYRSGGMLRAAWWTPLALGFGFLAKVSTVTLWPLVALAIVLGTAGEWRSVFRTWRRWLATNMLVFGGALLIASPWLLRNWSLYGDPLGTEMVRQTVDLRTTPWSLGDTAWLLRGWFYSFWGKFGGAGHIPLPEPLYIVLALILFAAAAGVVRLYLRKDWREERRSLSWLLLAVGAVALGIWQYSLVALGTDQARLLFPAIGPLAILLAAGLLAWLPVRWTGHGAAAIGAAALALGLYSLVGVVIPAFAAPAQAPAEEWQQVSAAQPITFGELTLVGYQLTPEPLLFWEAGDTTPTQDWRTVLRVTAEDGSQVWEWRRSPGAGRWSTDRWPGSAVVRDAYTIQWPDWAGPGRYRVEVGLQPYDEELVLPLAGGTAVTNSDHPFYELGWLERP
jgi:4-amino-4-deoxy-L-arabinose transferase-like glycosyltransferase